MHYPTHRTSDLYTLPDMLTRWLEERQGVPAGVVPAVDVLETDTEIRLMAECPGLSKESLNVSVENNTLTIAGEKRRAVEPMEGQYFRGERQFGKFSRSFTLPTRIETSKIQATYRDGILEVVLPKAAEAQPKKIEIRAE